jgi:hypothetical protein
VVGKLSLILGAKDNDDRPPSGRTATAVTMETKHKADELIQDDGRITTSELCAATRIGKLAVMAIIRGFGYTKLCARLVPKLFTVEHEAARIYIVQNFSCAVRKTEIILIVPSSVH